MKNQTNLCKLEALENPNYNHLDQGAVNAETEFKIDFRASSNSSNKITEENKCRRVKSINDFTTMDNVNEDYQNKENELPVRTSGLVLDSCYLSGLGNNITTDKRRGVKMGTKAFSNLALGTSRSMEAVNGVVVDYLEQMSLQSVSLHCSSNSISRSPTVEPMPPNEAFIVGQYQNKK